MRNIQMPKEVAEEICGAWLLFYCSMSPKLHVMINFI